MPYAVRPLSFKPPRLQGLSSRLLESHYENDYGGAVRRLNAIERRLEAIDPEAAPGFELAALKREELIAANSMILHEVYFEGLGGSGGDPSGDLAAAIERDFGCLAAWRRDFVATGKALAGGAGWVVLAWSRRLGRLHSHWAGDQPQSLADGVPILALDMYEHAYHLDFGADAGGYVDAVMENLDWAAVARRLARAGGPDPASRDLSRAPESPPFISVAELGERLEAPASAPVVLDVRLAEDLARLAQRLPGAAWRDMRQVEQWAQTLPRDRTLVVYCMYGFWVSQDTAAALRKKGYDVLSLEGGITAWRAMGLPTAPLESEQEERP